MKLAEINGGSILTTDTNWDPILQVSCEIDLRDFPFTIFVAERVAVQNGTLEGIGDSEIGNHHF